MVLYGTINWIPVKWDRNSFAKDEKILEPLRKYCMETGDTFEGILQKIGYCSTYLRTVKFVSSEFIDKLQALGVKIESKNLTPKMSLLDHQRKEEENTEIVQTFASLWILNNESLYCEPIERYVYVEDNQKNLLRYQGKIYTVKAFANEFFPPKSAEEKQTKRPEDFFMYQGATLHDLQKTHWKDALDQIQKQFGDPIPNPPTKEIRKNLTFEELNIPIGATLTFIPTWDEVRVISNKEISYHGVSYSMTGLTKILLPENQRTESNTYQWPKFFAYQGENLVDLRYRLEQERGNKETQVINQNPSTTISNQSIPMETNTNVRTFRKLWLKKEQNYLIFSPTGKYVYLEDIDKNLVKHLGKIYSFTECFEMLMGTMLYNHGYPCEYFFHYNGEKLDALIAKKGLDFYPMEYEMDADYKSYIESLKKRYIPQTQNSVHSPATPKEKGTLTKIPEQQIESDIDVFYPNKENPFFNTNYIISKKITTYCNKQNISVDELLDQLKLTRKFLSSVMVSEKNINRLIEAWVPIKKETLLRLNEKITIKREENSDITTVWIKNAQELTDFDQVLKESFLEDTEWCSSFTMYKQKKIKDYFENNQGASSFISFIRKT